MSLDDLNLDLTEVEPEKIGKGGGNYFPIGQYHVQVNSLEPWAGQNKDSTLIQFECLATNADGVQAGAQHNEYFSMSPKAYQRLLQLAIACRLTTQAQLKQWKDNNQKAKINWEAIEGRQCHIAVEWDEYNGQKRQKINFNIWDLDDPKCNDFPKNDVFAERHRKFFPLDNNSQSPPAKTEPAPQEQPATEEGDFDDVFA